MRAGILGFTRQIAVDYATRGIRVNAVSPGPVTTDLGRTSVENEPDFPPLGPAGSVRPLAVRYCRAFAPRRVRLRARLGSLLRPIYPTLIINPSGKPFARRLGLSEAGLSCCAQPLQTP